MALLAVIIKMQLLASGIYNCAAMPGSFSLVCASGQICNRAMGGCLMFGGRGNERAHSMERAIANLHLCHT